MTTPEAITQEEQDEHAHAVREWWTEEEKQSALIDRLGLLGESLLAEIRRLNARLDVLGQAESTSSFEIDSNGSAGKVKVKCKQYAVTVEEARAAAEVEFARGMANLEAAQERGWQETLAALQPKPDQPEIDAIRGAWSRARLGEPEACTELDALLGVPS